MNKTEQEAESAKPGQTGSPEQQTLTLQEALDLGLQHHKADDFSKAKDIYQQILKIDPSHPETLHLLGVVSHQIGENERAVDLITKALTIRPDFAKGHNSLGNVLKELGQLNKACEHYHNAIDIKPDYAEAHSNLGLVLHELRRLDDALVHYHKALTINPEFPEAHTNLGLTFHELGRLDDAVASYRKALAIKPNFAGAHYNLGNALRELGNLDESVVCYSEALAIKLDYAEAHGNLGLTLQEKGRLDDAIASYHKSLTIKPDFAEMHSNLGSALREIGRLDEAIGCYQKALSIKPAFAEAYSSLGNTLQEVGRSDEALFYHYKSIDIKPDFAVAHCNLAVTLEELGRLDEAVASYHKALAINSYYAEAHNNLGAALQGLGMLDEAVASYQKALSIKPDFTEAGRNLLFVMLYLPGLSQGELFTEHLRFSENHARDIHRPAVLSNDPILDRRLRVGYLSSDFRDHPVGRNILPLLTCHDRARFEVHCYAEVRHPDAITERFRTCVDHWHPIVGKSDAEVAEMVRTDKIDVLVSLAGRFDRNRPLVCVHRAAPVQVSYHDVATSGLEEMDYLLTDDFLNPPDTKEMFTEKLYRLPVFYQYPPIEEAPPVAAVPAGQTGIITFGSFNNPAKVNEEVIRLWAEVLRSVPGSRLLLKYRNLYDQISLRDRVVERISACGIEQNRIIFSITRDTLEEHLEHYCEVDIALDPFPFNGATTTFQALWMGVPVVALAGERFTGRMAGSILHHLGLGELVANSSEAYVACARNLAGDVARLETLRGTLRERIANSPLCDASTYTHNVETAYRDMWRT